MFAEFVMPQHTVHRASLHKNSAQQPFAGHLIWTLQFTNQNMKKFFKKRKFWNQTLNIKSFFLYFIQIYFILQLIIQIYSFFSFQKCTIAYSIYMFIYILLLKHVFETLFLVFKFRIYNLNVFTLKELISSRIVFHRFFGIGEIYTATTLE